MEYCSRKKKESVKAKRKLEDEISGVQNEISSLSRETANSNGKDKEKELLEKLEVSQSELNIILDKETAHSGPE